MKTKFWIAVIGALLAVCIGLILLLLDGGDARYAEIYSQGELLYTLDLRVSQSYTVENGAGVNEINVRDGYIAVTHANCPDQYCVKRGFQKGGSQIVCLPNRLIIRFTGSQNIDAVAG